MNKLMHDNAMFMARITVVTKETKQNVRLSSCHSSSCTTELARPYFYVIPLGICGVA